LTLSFLFSLSASSDSEAWETVKLSELNIAISYPAYNKKIHSRTEKEYARIQKYPADLYVKQLQTNQFFLEIMVLEDYFNLKNYQMEFCRDAPEKYSGYDTAYTCKPTLEEDATVTHILDIWKNGKHYHFQIDASQLDPKIVQKIQHPLKYWVLLQINDENRGFAI